MENGMAQSHGRPLANTAPRELCPDSVEQRIIRAYVQLAAAPDDADGTRTVTVFRRGSLEVRLTEVAQDRMMSLPPFWLELHSPTSGATIDSIGCHEFDEDELAAAVEFVLEATQRLRSIH
jgi:hypothetical protein